MNAIIGFGPAAGTARDRRQGTQLRRCDRRQQQGSAGPGQRHPRSFQDRVRQTRTGTQYGESEGTGRVDPRHVHRDGEKKKIRLVSAVDGAISDFVFLDENRIRQILVNLLNNALKFTEKGQIELKVSSKPEAQSASMVRLTFVVSDTGCGIPAKDLDAIFDPFTQGEHLDGKVREGTGLGLAITQRLVELMDGKISVTSEPGAGSTFSIEVPHVALVASVAHSMERPMNLDDLIPLAIRKILVVDDVALNRDLLVDLLQPYAQKIVLAGDGEEAVAVALAELPTLILMDVRMPRVDGREALVRLRAQPHLRATPVIAVTASKVCAIRETERLRLQFDGYVRKPISAEALAAEIVRVVSATPQQATDASVTLAPLTVAFARGTSPLILTGLEILYGHDWSQALKFAAGASRRVVSFVGKINEIGSANSAPDVSDYGARLGSVAACFRCCWNGARARSCFLLSWPPIVLRSLLHKCQILHSSSVAGSPKSNRVDPDRGRRAQQCAVDGHAVERTWL